jgi:23S rRNA pseudouridine1911/1915/1917 synthase
MVFAKSSKAASRLSEQLRNGDFEKRYYAVVCGTPKEEKATLINYLKKNAINNMVYVCTQTETGAKRAELTYTTLESKNDLSLVDVRLETGRSHQIRVQMNAIGCPVYGDMRYGGLNAKKGRLALWSYYLGFTHPVSKERLVFRVQPPKDESVWALFDTEKSVTILKPSL